MIRVFLIDDHRSILWGLERLIESGGLAMKVVGTATNSADALKRLGEAAPDVILLDLDLGRESGLDAIPALLAATQAKVLVLTGVRDKDLHDRAVMMRARGVVEKESAAGTILTAIGKVHAGELWVDRAAAGRILIEVSRKGTDSAPDPEQRKIATLTERERDIFAAMAAQAGATAKSVAASLNMSEHTLRNHLTSIYEKLGVANRLELFTYAHKHGLTKGSRSR